MCKKENRGNARFRRAEAEEGANCKPEMLIGKGELTGRGVCKKKANQPRKYRTLAWTGNALCEGGTRQGEKSFRIFAVLPERLWVPRWRTRKEVRGGLKKKENGNDEWGGKLILCSITR